MVACEVQIVGDNKAVIDVLSGRATSRNPELVDNAPDGAFLEALATNYQGAYYTSYNKPLMDKKAQREIPITHTLELSQSPLLGVLFCFFSGIGWVLRRRGGGR